MTGEGLPERGTACLSIHSSASARTVVSAVAGSGESVLVTLRSADPFTVVDTLSRLFALFGSSVELETAESLTRIVPGGTSGATNMTTVIVAVAALVMSPRLHRRSRAPGWPNVQLPCDVFTDTKLVPCGMVSVTTTLLAVDGPLFWTAMLYCICVPAVTEDGPVLSIARSAAPVKEIVPVAWLFAFCGSGVLLETV